MLLDTDEKILKESDNIERFKRACEDIIPAWCDRIVESLYGNDCKGKVCGPQGLSLPLYLHKYPGFMPFEIKYSDSKLVYMKIVLTFKTYEEAVNLTFNKLMRQYPEEIKKGLIILLPLEDKFDYKCTEAIW